MRSQLPLAFAPRSKQAPQRFGWTNLLNANSADAKFCNACLNYADLTDANVAKFHSAGLSGANLAGTIFCKDGLLAEGLTQDQIKFVVAKPKDKPPCLGALTDYQTGNLIFWQPLV